MLLVIVLACIREYTRPPLAHVEPTITMEREFLDINVIEYAVVEMSIVTSVSNELVVCGFRYGREGKRQIRPMRHLEKSPPENAMLQSMSESAADICELFYLGAGAYGLCGSLEIC